MCLKERTGILLSSVLLAMSRAPVSLIGQQYLRGKFRFEILNCPMQRKKYFLIFLSIGDSKNGPIKSLSKYFRRLLYFTEAPYT